MYLYYVLRQLADPIYSKVLFILLITKYTILERRELRYGVMAFRNLVDAFTSSRYIPKPLMNAEANLEY